MTHHLGITEVLHVAPLMAAMLSAHPNARSSRRAVSGYANASTPGAYAPRCEKGGVSRTL